MRKLIFIALAAGVTAGCGARVCIEPSADAYPVVDAEPVTEAVVTQPVTEAGVVPAQRVVYFNYGSSRLTDDAAAVVRAHAAYLTGAGEVSVTLVTLEGHTDERGPIESNLVLGEARAQSVADLLRSLGVDDARIRIVSHGELRPADAGSGEAAWALNRRVEILYP